MSENAKPEEEPQRPRPSGLKPFKKGDPRIGGYKKQREKAERLALEERQKALEQALGEKLVTEYQEVGGEAQLLSDMRWVYKNPDAATTGSRRVLKKLLVSVPKEFVAQLARLEEAQAKREVARSEAARATGGTSTPADDGTERALEVLLEEFADAVGPDEPEEERRVPEGASEKGATVPPAAKSVPGAGQG